jgi:hypothetical protein
MPSNRLSTAETSLGSTERRIAATLLSIATKSRSLSAPGSGLIGSPTILSKAPRLVITRALIPAVEFAEQTELYLKYPR